MIESKGAPVGLAEPAAPTRQVEPTFQPTVMPAAQPPAHPGHTQAERRYERKMRIAGSRREWVEMLIFQHPANLTKAYPSRYVNNLYLDTLRHSYYVDHVDGVPRRKKVRVRWYGRLEDDLFEPRLEMKSREGWTIAKRVYPLQPTCLERMLRPGGPRRAIETVGCPPSVGEIIAGLQPALINRYLRRYFETRDGRVRVTVDTEMSFYRADLLTIGPRSSFTDPAVIVEIKFGEHAIAEGTAVASRFPIPLNKNSKYVKGIQLLHSRY